MTREELKEVMPILTAFVDGKTIQCYDHNTGKWMDEREQLHTADLYLWPSDFRIKPEQTYRPFKDSDECWQEMLKHQPFGWVKTIANIPELHNISAIFPSAEFPVLLCIDLEEGEAREYSLKLSEMYDIYTFADGAPFGMKEE